MVDGRSNEYLLSHKILFFIFNLYTIGYRVNHTLTDAIISWITIHADTVSIEHYLF